MGNPNAYGQGPLLRRRASAADRLHRADPPLSAARRGDCTALDNALSTIDQWILPDQIQLIADLAYAF
ncbi:MAG TPA: hypothetical protein VKG83_13655 [Mycobacterium sp.]|nr:hypothetical protein [Mycobacterium sp.]